MSTGKVILSVMAGIAVGAIAGILYAPEKGSVTRSNIARKGGELRDGVKERVSKVGDFISDKFDGARSTARDLIDAGRSNIHEVKKEAKSA